MANEKKIRLGNGKKKNPTWLKASICLTDALEHSFSYEGKKYIKVDINVYDEPNQYGKDVAITLDTYKPDQSKSADVPVKKTAPAAPVEDAEVIDEDLPF
jgi:hypothetical protein